METAEALKQQSPATQTPEQPLTTDIDSSLQQITEAARTRRINSVFKGASTLMAAGVTLGGIGEAKENLAESSESPKTEIVNKETSYTTTVGGKTVKDTDISKGRVKILGQVHAKGIKKKYLKKENCYTDTDGFYNSGVTVNSPVQPRSVNDVAWFRDNRAVRICRVPRNVSPTGLIKPDCGNFVSDRPPVRYIIKTPVIMVRNLAKASVHVKATSKAEASAYCETPDGRAGASASGMGKGYAKGRVNLRALVKAKGKGRAVARINGNAFAEASSSASAKAIAHCSSTETVPNTPTHPQPKNNPPKGDMKPPQHLYSEGKGKICVDNISDPEGDAVKAYDFRVYKNSDSTKAGIGQFTSEVYSEPGGAQCRDYKAPYTTESYKAVAVAKLTDGRNPVDANSATYDFNIFKDDFGS